jgi:hypothetical protein
MRPLKILRLVLLFILSLSLSHASVQARPTAPARRANGPRPIGHAGLNPARPAPARDATPPPTRVLPSRDGLINSAYLDAASVLSEENECSRFFGGPYAATTVLTRLAGQLRATKLAPGVGIRMYGRVTDFEDSARGFRYRLFEKAVVNVAGPFSARQNFTGDPPVQNVGSFRPDTREARVLMLLHEIGHLITGPDSNWLLPNDGGDAVLSEKNTSEVESHCRTELLALDH